MELACLRKNLDGSSYFSSRAFPGRFQPRFASTMMKNSPGDSISISVIPGCPSPSAANELLRSPAWAECLMFS